MGSYTDGKGELNLGTTEDKNYSYGLYGGWFGKSGQFVDITLKRHNITSDYNINTISNPTIGHYNMSGTSASVEYGWRLGIQGTHLYAEPQTEFLYGYMKGADYTTSKDVNIHQSAIKTAVGRLGIAAGWLSPDKNGNLYIKASVLNDWAGDSKIMVSKGVISCEYVEDMGGSMG